MKTVYNWCISKITLLIDVIWALINSYTKNTVSVYLNLEISITSLRNYVELSIFTLVSILILFLYYLIYFLSLKYFPLVYVNLKCLKIEQHSHLYSFI